MHASFHSLATVSATLPGQDWIEPTRGFQGVSAGSVWKPATETLWSAPRRQEGRRFSEVIFWAGIRPRRKKKNQEQRCSFPSGREPARTITQTYNPKGRRPGAGHRALHEGRKWTPIDAMEGELTDEILQDFSKKQHANLARAVRRVITAHEAAVPDPSRAEEVRQGTLFCLPIVHGRIISSSFRFSTLYSRTIRSRIPTASLR